MQHDETIRCEIENMLRQRIGLNPESVGSRSILRAVKKGMRTGKMQGLGDYWRSLQASPSRFASLVESVVVPETSFFRNRASFVFLRQWVSQEWSRSERPLRVLSLPCSTGEEPYSIAITLLEEGLSFDDFQVDAVDISTLALEKARQGIYSPYAFRRQTYRSDDKYFTLSTPEGVTQGKRITQRYFLTDSVKQKVTFRQGNALSPQLLADQPPYDIVFCRNLLIYFDREGRDRTFAKINQLLRPNGLLFLGYAETSMVDPECYQSVPYPQTFAYRKQKNVRRPKMPTESAQSVISANRFDTAQTRKIVLPRSTVVEAVNASSNASPSASPNVSEVSLESAQSLADSGELIQAGEACDRYLQAYPSSAAAHLLRGELHQATGDELAAETSYEKALYLDPQMSEALTHLMLIKEEKDAEGAAVMRERLQRLT